AINIGEETMRASQPLVRQNSRHRPVYNVIATAAALVLTVATGYAGNDRSDGDGHMIETLSAPSNLVSGGQVLVQVPHKGHEPLRIVLNGSEITDKFHADSNSDGVIGLVDGLRIGRNLLRATSGKSSDSLEITNYPITGPMISGPHEVPFIC